MSNPVLVEVIRGSRVESRHRGAVAVTDSDGRLVVALGDVEARVFPRSAVKAIQALPLVESGVADRLGLSDIELALACASHRGEPVHVATAAAMLGKAGCDETCLECGIHWPFDETAARALAAAGHGPSPLHNNCSGKHAGFICLACGLDEKPRHYVRPEHPVQREVRSALAAVTGATIRDEDCATDGCSIPTYALPLSSIARGFARLATGHGLGPGRAHAAQRLRQAVAAHPFMVAGTRQFDTLAMQTLGERVFTKVGAEGVHCCALPEAGLGIAVKIDDGSDRAREAVMATLIRRFVALSPEEESKLAPRFHPSIRNWNGIETGRITTAPELQPA